MVELVEVEHEVLKREILDSGTIIDTHYCLRYSISLEAAKTEAAVGESVNISIGVKDWQGNYVANKDSVTIRVSNEQIGNIEEEILIENGIGTFEFVSEMPGIFKIRPFEPNYQKNEVVINVT